MNNIRIVLVNTSHTGNIGSVARAMKTMGLNDLYLVDPVQAPDSHASALAAGATDVLHQAKIVKTLPEAIQDCGLVVGTSARNRTLDWPLLGPRETAAKVLAEAPNYPVAMVFGRESSGLTNEELQQCTHHVHIPSNPEYSSLNLAMAVQTLAYEVRMQFLEADAKPPVSDVDYPLAGDLERFYQHLEETLGETGFIIKNHPGQVMAKLRRMFSRARPESAELNILRGILTSIDKKNKNDIS
ncbi:tRNA (cytosine(32)/uridine(32)-2'-O)-methyltransferase TrmJ [Pseudidiomarina gelatinasegens]|uniref:tRNA (cytidine/uridine-2'-O-)-methyltransferase TrmJ n=1 Tax=Pseudidiomarina gelatinasegens TaxID=2487740 RepID=A0A443Z7U3_9GAMM|nr:tRNA (cytosine(32)/uridine(32)-2'-O)-methyltransferase TrmJ [Pseudidiomarina gelatinasegens]RWU12994.1 tRNA (cytosine(32)/uridine(32)-2'-O)-methyltransferase TrmJ [Pseudidiomarina gelatinasegens]